MVTRALRLEIVREVLFAPLFEQFANHYNNAATRFIGEDEFVVVECESSFARSRNLPHK